MRIQNDPQTITTNTTNFKSIRSIKLKGLYKNAPELGKELIDTFQNNPKAMDFCKKYDVDIIFKAEEKKWNNVKSSIQIFYDSPYLSKVTNFFKALTGNRDNITIKTLSTSRNLQRSLMDSTDTLKEDMLPQPEGSGYLDDKISSAEEKISKILTKQSNEAKEVEINKKAQQKLDDSIQNLIKNTK